MALLYDPDDGIVDLEAKEREEKKRKVVESLHDFFYDEEYDWLVSDSTDAGIVEFEGVEAMASSRYVHTTYGMGFIVTKDQLGLPILLNGKRRNL